MAKVTRQQLENQVSFWDAVGVVEMPGGGSVVARRGLGRKLKALREAAGKDYVDVAEAGIASRAKLHRVETGQTSIRVPDVIALCRLCGVDAATTDSLVAMAPATASAHDYIEQGVQPGWFSIFQGLEAAAARLRCWDETLVYGVLQTEDYARAVTAAEPGSSDDVIASRVKLRLDRQRRVLGNRPDLTVIMGEAALSIVVGSPAIVRDQIEHLRQVDRDGVASVRVLPFSAGAYPRRGAVHLVELADDDDPNLVYVEGAGTAKYLDKPADWARYEEFWKILTDMSTPIEEWKR